MADVFLSYSREDEESARLFAEGLAKPTVRVLGPCDRSWAALARCFGT